MNPGASADGVHQRNLPGDFFCGAGQWNWTFFLGQTSDDMAASQAGSRDEVKGGVWSCGKNEESSIVRDTLQACHFIQTLSSENLKLLNAWSQHSVCANKHCIRALHSLIVTDI